MNEIFAISGNLIGWSVIGLCVIVMSEILLGRKVPAILIRISRWIGTSLLVLILISSLVVFVNTIIIIFNVIIAKIA